MNLIALVGFIGSGKDTAGRHLVETHGYYDIAFADALKDTCAAVFCWDREMLDGKNPQSREWRNQIDPWWAEHLEIPHFTPRWALQHIGTDVMRKFIRDDLWILNVRRRIDTIREQHGPETKIVLTDGRFPNELAMIRDLGGSVVRVKRGVEPSWFIGLNKYRHYLPKDIKISHLWENTNGGSKINREFVRQMVELYVDRKDADEVFDSIVSVLESDLHVSEWAWVGSPFDAVIGNDSSLDDLFGQIDCLLKSS